MLLAQHFLNAFLFSINFGIERIYNAIRQKCMFFFLFLNLHLFGDAHAKYFFVIHYTTVHVNLTTFVTQIA